MAIFTDKNSDWREAMWAKGSELATKKHERNVELNKMVEQMRGDNQFRVANLNADVSREEIAAKKPLFEAQANSINTETGTNKAMADFQLQEAPGMLKLNKEGISTDIMLKKMMGISQMESFMKGQGMAGKELPPFMKGIYGKDYDEYLKKTNQKPSVGGAVAPATAPGSAVAKPSANVSPTSGKRTGPSSWLREASRYGLPAVGGIAGAVSAGGWNFGAGSVPGLVAGGAAGTALDNIIWGDAGTPMQQATNIITGGLGTGMMAPGSKAASTVAGKVPGIAERLSKRLTEWK
jgi:hypothetical protein